ncbi:MAG: hypothetical protein K0M70_11540, partial [Arenimonas sp.]|nr:hypothetical protein [Arenimonas sp.]
MKRLALSVTLLALLGACREPAVPTAPEAPPPPAREQTEAPTASPSGPAEPGQVPRAFLCRGNEPFWALDIHANGALLKTPDAETELLGELKANQGGSFAFRGAPDGSPEEAVSALIVPGQCFDTMADGPALPFSAQASLPGGEVASGCCSVEYGLDLANAPEANAGTKDAADWSRLLPQLSGAVQRCVSDAGVATDVVTTAWPMNRGKAGVRLRDAGGDRFDCVVDLETGAIEDVKPVAAEDVMPGEGSPLWLPAREVPPVLHCGRVERVTADQDGGILPT